MKIKEELTPWFPASIKPAYVGVYLCLWEGSGYGEYFNYWDGNRFCWGTYELDAAFAASKDSTNPSIVNLLQWRGLIKEPQK